MSAGHGSIPPEEKLRLYLEYHAMMAAAGGLVDAGSPVHISSWDDAGDPWRDWLVRHLPLAPDTWLADLRGPVPAEPDLYGRLPPLDAWDTAANDEYDRLLDLTSGRPLDQLLVSGHIGPTPPAAASAPRIPRRAGCSPTRRARASGSAGCSATRPACWSRSAARRAGHLTWPAGSTTTTTRRAQGEQPGPQRQRHRHQRER